MPKSQNYMRRVLERFLAIPSPETKERMVQVMDDYADGWIDDRVTAEERENLDAKLKALTDKA